MVVLNAADQPGANRSRIGRPFILILLALCLFALCGPRGSLAQTNVSKEYQVKAAFLYNFAQFVEWPAQTYTNTDQPFTIGILGEDPFGPALDQTVQGETIHSRKLNIQRARRPEDLKDCQVIFICKSEKSHLPEILPKCAGQRVLTVSEIPGFAGHGGMINFYLDGSKVRFEINPDNAQRAELRISSQLLSLGKVIASDAPKPN